MSISLASGLVGAADVDGGAAIESVPGGGGAGTGFRSAALGAFTRGLDGTSTALAGGAPVGADGVVGAAIPGTAAGTVIFGLGLFFLVGGPSPLPGLTGRLASAVPVAAAVLVAGLVTVLVAPVVGVASFFFPFFLLWAPAPPLPDPPAARECLAEVGPCRWSTSTCRLRSAVT